jgi:hypothetical protein
MCAPRVTRHTSIWYSSSCHTRVKLGASIFFTAVMICTYRSVRSRRSSEEYRCTHVDACVARTWISYRRAPCHPWCTYRTSLVVKKNLFSFPVAVNNSINVGPLIFLLEIFIITENIMKRPLYPVLRLQAFFWILDPWGWDRNVIPKRQ